MEEGALCLPALYLNAEREFPMRKVPSSLDQEEAVLVAGDRELKPNRVCPTSLA